MNSLTPLRLQGQGPGGNDLRPYPPAGEPGHRKPFAALPHDLVGDQRLSATAVRLAAVLLRYARGKPICWPSVARLAADLGRCRRTVQYALRELEQAGWVAAEPTSENATGRVLVLTWRPRSATRAPRCTPPAQPVAPLPAQPVAPEVRQQEKNTPTGGQGQESPPPSASQNGEPIQSADDARKHYAGWLDRPPGDPLRIIAEARLREIEVGRSASRQAMSEAIGATTGRTPSARFRWSRPGRLGGTPRSGGGPAPAP
jgi:DNA-binding MarR family transcriptional regulator